MKGLMYINGAWTEAISGARKEVRNPATGEPAGSVPIGSREDLAAAIDAAHAAFKSWSKTTAMERAVPLYRAYEKLAARADDIARMMTAEQGKPLAESRGEVMLAAEYLRWYSEEAKRIYGETIPASAQGKRIMVVRQPIGVVGAITPWNFPVSMLTRKLGPALAAGCTVVLKPADYTPLSAVALFQALEEAGFPPGVVNLVTAKGRDVGAEFLENPKVKKITFTGSTEVGKQLIEGSAKHVKRVSMELGGHAPFLVFEDADLDKAAEACIASKFRNAGQTCICANRIFVQESVMDAFAEKFAAKARQLKIGNGLEPGVEVGPLIDWNALEKVEEQVRDALSKGAELASGGRRYEGEGLKGAFYEPTVLSRVDSSMVICYEETFGPVAPLISFSTEEEAVAKANDTEYGLASYVFTRNLGRAFRVSEQLEYGIVGVNDALPTVVQAPFGGWKESGTGREGGHHGLDSYLEIKYISIDLND
ncbi:NAD-dependent succinate-semialdehyde dehydrogenase [Cohnella hongkongensis]|uniref:NAD-dependent succinate-semialdehyde dehydrogenase n=1 Tax=Cohnella hongkongensis TaxID=178337 RepID=A0ABV9F710_9BACL